MNLRRLKYFIKIVDVGSLTQAADILHIAQPALSQQLATLEGEVNQKLLIRTKRGVTPTNAGKILYSHAQAILRQCAQAQSAIDRAGGELSGSVSVGLAPGTAAQQLALPLMAEVQRQYPGIVLYFNENFGTTLSELIMNGRMDMAVIYDNRNIHGLRFIPLMKEPLCFVCPNSLMKPKKEITLAEVAQHNLFLPRIYNIMRKIVDEAFIKEGLTYQVKCEIESQTTLNAVLAAGMGCTIMPDSAARSMLNASNAWMAKIIDPDIYASLSFCMSDHLSLSEPAEVVKNILLSLMADRTPDNRPLTLVS
ncbi:nitrogen assimilation regulatory protein [Pectobacterium atrosepticum SCRI1043]|uniref:Nitrogen assimilation regulatory protein n=1 Tax=Pectobacterium atrosepticum (strain SCRI 1043 / ATCC BAA-672) TaxID=218491 RepID=Q6CYM4_PECAS|nr:nitrogen assimilation transcriptional regulator NAC [Pectobacterium atrosepticum]GKV87924.1 LysR family transcriptional regulator [Pectobacterium carotovorum subsp. carotovorum]AIA73236.1 nitrogen assimilation transcriptional regulator [Pectobacterium atrosepticum]AIK16266.1 nitrogen assimilation regulatory protein [Pectobacterium atrosepticum]ATY92902.1 nitrogen assimilation transcriptional regulator [Pectobacterium atrosepticum]KFX17485.1 nitrogen assimilation transcriptional regulator [P